MLKNLRHPNILLIMGADTKGPSFFIVPDFCESGNLFELLHHYSNFELSWEERKRIALEIARGMNYLHSFQPPIVHRDLKSINVLLEKNFQVRIADFGTSKFLDVKMSRQIGTFQWMAPKEIMTNTYTEKANVFSFGIISNEIAVRKSP
jgi:serine/threonine protein kinase